MDEEGFYSYLHKGGREEKVIYKIIKIVKRYETYLKDEEGGKILDEAGTTELANFIEQIEHNKKGLGKKYLYGIVYYYAFSGNTEMKKAASEMRKEHILRSSFKLKEFMGANDEYIRKLEAIGIRTTSQMLVVGKTPSERKQLAQAAGIPDNAVEELVKLSDLARIPGVKGVRARLYYESGVDTLDKLAAWEPMALREMLVDYVMRTGFEGIATLPKEAEYTVAQAKTLPRIVEY
jgi:predicted flap endonuclease-1-like 5' DNA nuclease